MITQMNSGNINTGLSGISFGMEAYDTCGQVGNALNAVHQYYPQSAAASYSCANISPVKNKLGIIGPMQSDLSKAVGEFAPKIPASVVSMRSSAPELSNKALYPTFLRTDQSSAVFAKAVTALLKQIQWERILIVHGDDAYGMGGYQEILKAAYETGICVSGEISVPHYGTSAQYQNKLKNIMSYKVYAIIFFGDMTDALTTMQAMQTIQGTDTEVSKLKWLFSDLEQEQGRDYAVYTAAQGAIAVLPTTTTFSTFSSYFTSLNVNNPPSENPWLQDWFMRKYKCKFQGVNYNSYTQDCLGLVINRTEDFRQSPYVELTVITLYTYVEAMKTACRTMSCNSNWNISPLDFHNILKKVDYTFPQDFFIRELAGRRVAYDINGDLIYSAYTFYNFINVNGAYRFQQFGTYQGGIVNKASDPVYTRPTGNLALPSLCGNCSNCLRSMQGIKLAYKAGDLIVAALVEAHAPDSTGLGCGMVIPDRLIDAVAARYGADQASSPMLSIGYLIVDVCPGKEAAQSFLTSLFGGYYIYTDSAGVIIDPTNIVAVFDMTREDTGWMLAPILDGQGLPQIRVAPTSTNFITSSWYPNAISAVPTRVTVHLAIVQMLSVLRWNYVQIVSESQGSYYDAAEDFRSVASQNGICVVMWSTFDMDPVSTVKNMRSIQDAPVVVVFGNALRMRSLLEAVKTITSVAGINRTLTFIAGSEELGRSDRVITGFEAQSQGNIVLQLSEQSNSNFDQWLDGLSSSDIASDLFLAEWLETKYGCSLNSATRGRYTSVCSSTLTIAANEVYQGYAPYIIKGIKTVAEGVPSNFRNLGNVSQLVANYLRNSNTNNGFSIMNSQGMSDLLYFNYKSGSFGTSVGQFNSQYQRFTSAVAANQIVMADGVTKADSITTQCTGRCPQCQVAYSYQEKIFIPGDYLVGGTFAIRNPGPTDQQPFVCGAIRTDSRGGFQYSTSMQFAIDNINRGLGPVKLNNVTLGAFIGDHCNNARRAYGHVSYVYSGLSQLQQEMDMYSDSGIVIASDFLAWLTDNTASTTEVAEILQPLRVSIVSPSATSASLMTNPTFFRTIQGDGTTAVAIVRLCKTLGFSYIQVVYEGSVFGRSGLETLTNAARQEGLCVINSVEMSSTANVSSAITRLTGSTSKVVVMYLGTTMTTTFLAEAAKLSGSSRLTLISPEPFTSVITSTPNSANLDKLLSLQLQNPVLSDYSAYINNITARISDPFFARYYMATFQCNLPGYYMYSTACASMPLTGRADYTQGDYTIPTINAVYSVAQALHETLVEFCGKDYNGQCAPFLQSDIAYARFIEHLKLVKFSDPSSRSFQFVEREGNIVYNVLRFNGPRNSYEVIGTFGSASLNLTQENVVKALYSSVQAQCQAQCIECIFSGLSFSHTPGDIYLGGVFDVHQQGQGVFDCGTINTEHGFQLLEAFHFALQQVNSKQGIFSNILSGITLGGVGLDACQSPIRGGYIVSNINNKLTTLVKDGVAISSDMIDVYIGSYSSDSSIYLADILTDLKTPQISYAATTSTLKDQFFFPYFFRTVPSDDRQVLAILSYLNTNNLRYVQVLYTDDSYGVQSLAQFDVQRAKFSICVAQRVVFPESGVVSEVSSDDVVYKILQKRLANTVVIFAGTNYIRAFLKAVERKTAITQTFKFIGPSTWGISESVTDGIRGAANDAVTFVLDFQGGVGGFLTNYLYQRTPSNAKNNPWFEEFFQYTLNCHTSPSYAATFPQTCLPTASLVTKVMEDNGILHVMNAVYAAAFALDATLKQKCGANHQTVCESYRSSKTRRDDIRDNLELVSFIDPTNEEFHFVNRSGNKGYQLYKLTSSPTEDIEIVYNKANIGSFSSNDLLSLKADLVPKYDGSCERVDACVECPTIRNRGTRFAIGGDTSGSVTLVGIFDIHKKGTELYQCGELNMDGFLQFLTFFWTYNTMTFQQNGIRLLALDTCSSPLRVGQDLYNLLKDGSLCNSEYWQKPDLVDGLRSIGGVVVTGQENTVVASRVLEPLKVTYVSSESVSPLMDGQQYLLRARTPWSGFARLLALFLRDSGWTYISTMYSNASLVQEGFRVFSQAALSSGICLRASIPIAEDAIDADIITALQTLDSSSGAQVVVLFGETAEVIKILKLAQDVNLADKFLWVIGTDDPQLVNNIPQGLSLRALVLRPKVPTWSSFSSSYYNNLRFENGSVNHNVANIPRVWWEDFYQEYNQCHLDKQVAQYPLMKYTNLCSLDKIISQTFPYSKLIHYTHLASHFAMKGSTTFYGDNCRGGETVAACLDRKNFTRQYIRDNILNSVYNSQNPNEYFKWYTPLRYIEGNYEIRYINVRNGIVDEENPTLYKEYLDGKFKADNFTINIQSQCQLARGCGCQKTSASALEQTAQFNPTAPRNYYKYDGDGNQVYTWPVWAIVVCILTCVGLLITIIVFLYLLFAYPVKGGTSILGYMTMIGIMGIYAINFAFFVGANNDSCGARRFLMGVVYMIVFGALLVKAVDNWRFHSGYSNQEYRGLTNPLFLFLIAFGVVLLQCIIPIEWLILVHPTASKWTSSNIHDYWWCDPPEIYDIGLVLSFIFVMFIILLTAIFATLSWDSESNNYESRWILGAAICTAGCFLVWMIVSTMATPPFRDAAVTIGNLVNASLILILIPLRKMHLLCVSKNEKDEPYNNGEYFNNQSFDPNGEDYQYDGEEKISNDRFQ